MIACENPPSPSMPSAYSGRSASGVHVPAAAGGVDRDLPFHLATCLCHGAEGVLDVCPHPEDLPGGEQGVDPSPGAVPVGNIPPWAPREYQRHWGPLIVWLGASGVMSGSWVWGPGVACLGATWGS